MSIAGALKQTGFTPQKSTVGDKRIYNGVYKCLMVGYKYGYWADRRFCELPFGAEHPDAQIAADFKSFERLAGDEIAKSDYPDFRGGFNTAPEKCNNKKSGFAKLVNGFFSVGKTLDTSSDEKLKESLDAALGSYEVYIKAFADWKNVKQADDTWKKDKDGDQIQGWSFMTEKNALKEAEKMKKKQGHPL
jgi:hypothetical protein